MSESHFKISILIPVRNEEANLDKLFQSINQLNYPVEQLEILMGNDASTDQSAMMMDDFAQNKSYIRVIHLKENPDSGLKGKTRVLNQLAEISTGDYLFFTDADIELPPDWVQGILEEFEKGQNVGVVIGVTGFRKKNLWSVLQGIEWLMALSIFKIFADLKIPSTGLGNNMAVSRKAYSAVGGYKKIGFSIVEDFHLYNQIILAGFDFRHAFNPGILAFTVSPERYFEQRRRWIGGAMKAKPLAMLPALMQAFFFPVLAVIFFIKPGIAGALYGLIVLLYGILIVFFERKLRIKGYLFWLFPFSIYISLAWFLQFGYFLFKKELIWKGRKY